MKQTSRSSISPALPLLPQARFIAFAACALTLVLALRLWSRSQSEFFFEDAYMFFRYAIHLHHGIGISWNPGGPHTFGLTSLPWLVVVWLGTFVSSTPMHLLPSLSITVGMVALFLLALLFSRRARSLWLRHVEITFPLVALPLLFTHGFDTSISNGMETMLGLLLITLFLDGTLRFIDHPDIPHSLTLALLAFLAVLTRPEAIIPVTLTAVCTLPLLPRSRRVAPLAVFFAVLASLLAADLLINRWYFGSPVPLAFFIKAVHGYDDYVWLLNPFAANLTFFAMASLAITAIVLFAHRRHLGLLLLFLLPLAAILLYLLTVLQIMGLGARYYVPFLPFLLFPALLLTDEAFASTHLPDQASDPSPIRSSLPLSFPRLAAVAVALILSNAQYAEHFFGPLGTVLARGHRVWDPPVFAIDADQQLPKFPDLWVSYRAVARIAAHLPPSSHIALTEVGIVGASAPEIHMLDMAGLNDAFLARHHFDVDYIFNQQPDAIWLPNTDYTRSYGIFCSDPRLLRDYTVFANAFLFGVAVRKQSLLYDQILATLQPEFAKLYPGIDMSRHQVRSVTWNPLPTHTVNSLHTVEP